MPKANAPLVAALEAAKAARLPAHIEAQVNRIGVKPERQEPRRPYVAWKPTPDDPTPPF